jgi:hypothetical protein
VKIKGSKRSHLLFVTQLNKRDLEDEKIQQNEIAVRRE